VNYGEGSAIGACDRRPRFSEPVKKEAQNKRSGPTKGAMLWSLHFSTQLFHSCEAPINVCRQSPQRYDGNGKQADG